MNNDDTIYQIRLFSTVDNESIQPWQDVSKDLYDEKKVAVGERWRYETRVLYTAPQTSAPAQPVEAVGVRTAFEKWAGAKGYALHIRDMKGSTRLGEYGYADTQRLWEAWQAALAHPRGWEVVGVAKLEALASKFDERCRRHLLASPCGQYADSFGQAADLLRVLINEAAIAQARSVGVPDGWLSDSDSIPSAVIDACRDAIRVEFGDNGTDGYYKRILAKVFAAMASDASEVPRG